MRFCIKVLTAGIFTLACFSGSGFRRNCEDISRSLTALEPATFQANGG